MRFRFFLAGLLILFTGTILSAQVRPHPAVAPVTGDALGVHSLGPGSKSHITGARPDACAYCHAPHSGLNIGLWNQKLTTQGYTMYGSDTEQNRGIKPTLGSDSNQCLSCHDGTVAVGATVAYGQVTTSGSMSTADVFPNDMHSSHPFSLVLPLKDNVHLVASLVGSGKTGDSTGAVRLIKGNVECTSCHNPHIQAKDQVSQNFLVKDSSSGQLCLACHDPNRQMGNQVNPLADWSTSAHATSTDKISSQQAMLGSYPTVATDACISCHTPHNAAASARNLRGQDEQDCIACHNGANITGMYAYNNVFAEYGAGKVGHPFPSSNYPHDAAEKVLLNNNRHATCVDCHNAHGSEPVGVFPGPPLIRLSQKNVAGINASDGISVLTPAVNQYENCLRCHGAGSGKQVLPIYGYSPIRAVAAGDPLNLIPQFADQPNSSHPVMHRRTSPLTQYSLMSNMLNLTGGLDRAMGNQIFCTDCHNSDDNREFGGSGANGPHGSRWTHILERRYEFSQAGTPGGTISNLFLSPDVISVSGPYALCGKCHDLPNQIMKDTGWNHHSSHINAGFTCSTCHTAHGMGGTNGSISGERMVNFDLNVVASNGGNPISYSHANNTCVLVCHRAVHNGNTVTTLALRGVPGVRK